MRNAEFADLLEYYRKQAFSIAKEELQQQYVEDNVSYWTVSKELVNFLSVVINKSLYDRRDHLADDEGNGLRLWQRLLEDYEGGDLLTDISGRDRFMTFPKIDERELSDMLDDWMELRINWKGCRQRNPDYHFVAHPSQQLEATCHGQA